MSKVISSFGRAYILRNIG